VYNVPRQSCKVCTRRTHLYPPSGPSDIQPITSQLSGIAQTDNDRFQANKLRLTGWRISACYMLVN